MNYYTLEFGIFTIYCNSVLEDAKEFYKPIVERLQHVVDGKRDLQFDFRIKYYNSPSIMWISRILTILQGLSSQARVTVNWYYDSDDEDMKEVGIDYKEVFKMPINLVSN